MTLARIIASVLGIGYLGRGSGSIAALLTVALWYALDIGTFPLIPVAVTLVLICAIGVVVSNVVEPAWGHDSSKIVIDEFAGMGIALFALPTHWGYLLGGFVLFRYFDIYKPIGIARMEELPKGLGVMGDDILAGLYANVVLHLVVLAQISIAQ